MNFVDAAVSILSDNPGQALHVEEICRRAVEGGLLSRPGKAPLRSLKGRLTTELKKGEGSRVAKVGDNLWQLSGVSESGAAEEEISPVAETAASDEQGGDAAGEPMPTAEAAEGTDAADAGRASGAPEDPPARRRKRRRRRPRSPRGERADARGRGRNGGEDLGLGPDSAEPTEPKEPKEPMAPAPDRVEVPEARGDIEAIIAPDGRGARAGDIEVPAEDVAGELYADELEALAPDSGIPEFSDAQTADEDRPMLPEIGGRKERQQKYREQRNEERKQERERRRTERKRRSEERVARGGRRGNLRTDDSAVRGQSAATARPLPDAPAHVRPGNAWGQAAAELLSSNTQAVQVKQLAQMMRKRDSVPAGFPPGEAEARPLLHAALLAHIRSIENAGLRSDIVYRGRDLFAAAAAERGENDTEHDLASALIAQRLATHSALAAVLQELPINGFMQLVHVYLMQSGWSDVRWVKRVATADYAANFATAKPLAAPREILVSACATDGPLGRRGVGELRAGVSAKSLQSGLLFSAHELSEEAHAELEREGAPIHVVAGAAFVDLVMRAGIGVQHESVPVARLDATFWSELSRP